MLASKYRQNIIIIIISLDLKFQNQRTKILHWETIGICPKKNWIRRPNMVQGFRIWTQHVMTRTMIFFSSFLVQNLISS